MASADVCDIPQMQSPRPVKVSKRSAEQDSTESKKARFDFSQKIRDSTPWFANMQAASFKNVTKPASRRTLFVLTAEDGTDQFCVVGRVMSSRLSEHCRLRRIRNCAMRGPNATTTLHRKVGGGMWLHFHKGKLTTTYRKVMISLR